MIFHMICDCFTLLTANLRVSWGGKQVAQQSGEEEAESINQVGGGLYVAGCWLKSGEKASLGCMKIRRK